MKDAALKVTLCIKGEGPVTARLKLKDGRAYVVVNEFLKKGSDESICDETVELEISKLHKLDSSGTADYYYEQEIEMPNTSNN